MFKPVSSSVDFPALEREWLKKWYEEGIVEKYLKRNDTSEKKYSFLDGPITANNPMGVHHGWGRTYKDLWQRWHNMRGYKQRFQNGFDEQGLWVEVEVEKELGLKSKKDIENLVPGDKFASLEKFINLSKERVKKYSAIQTEQSKRLGYFMDWDNSYHTSSDENNYAIWNFLKVVNDKGWLYKGHDSVPWCPRCGTAISQHEIESDGYKLVTHESIYFELPIEGKDKEYLLVWTTTPWTLPANIAVAVDEKMEYSLVEGTSGDNFWVAKELVETVFKGELKGVVKTVKGKELVGLKYSWAFDNLPKVKEVAEKNPGKFHLVIATDERIMPISTTEGTGLVHTAVSAGVEDFALGKKLGLPLIEVIDEEANYLEGLGDFSGKNAKKNPKVILDYLEEQNKKGNWVFKIEPYQHRYPTCWRCGTELVWRVVDEWYISMDKKDEAEKTFREQMVEVAVKISWHPRWGLDRELDWLKNMHDWLISKKRYWGLALPIWECKKCRHFEIIGGKEELK
ncbi:MAG: Isoleucyl-tRNA synthetase, partial [Candidatus Woesebacteria bacterium GW2011_GWB1_38_5b]